MIKTYIFQPGQQSKTQSKERKREREKREREKRREDKELQRPSFILLANW